MRFTKTILLNLPQLNNCIHSSLHQLGENPFIYSILDIIATHGQFGKYSRHFNAANTGLKSSTGSDFPIRSNYCILHAMPGLVNPFCKLYAVCVRVTLVGARY